MKTNTAFAHPRDPEILVNEKPLIEISVFFVLERYFSSFLNSGLWDANGKQYSDQRCCCCRALVTSSDDPKDAYKLYFWIE
jgi:hypothetical protein